MGSGLVGCLVCFLVFVSFFGCGFLCYIYILFKWVVKRRYWLLRDVMVFFFLEICKNRNKRLIVLNFGGREALVWLVFVVCRVF